MNVGRVLTVSILVGALNAGAEVIWRDSFADKSVWPTFWDHNKSLKVEFGAVRAGMANGALAVSGTIKNPERLRYTQIDTAWHLESRQIPIAGKAPKFAISYRVSGETKKGGEMVGDATYYSKISWYDAQGDNIGSRGIPMLFPMDGSLHDVRLVDLLPKDAAFFSVRVGIDSPNLADGEEIRFSDVTFELLGQDAVCGSNLPDRYPPRVTVRNPGPSEDVFRPLAMDVTDPAGVDWKTLAVKLDGREATGEFAVEGNVLSLKPRKEAWTNGLHTVDVRIADRHGNAYSHRKTFFIGRKPDVPRIELRDDGVTLIGGKPFFPVGIYRVMKNAFNAYDFDRAMSDLSKAGFNTVHSYVAHYDADYLAAVRKYGMKMIKPSYGESRITIERERFNPDILTWYIGDDTSQYYKSWEFADREDSMRSIDTMRPTSQANVTWPDSPVDCYENYAASTDVFLPEIYPVLAAKRPKDNPCVAEVIRTMKRIHQDNAVKGGNRHHAVWPIIQNFRGWDSWHRYPDADEVYAMSFASIIHGAKGITWYAYSGATEPERRASEHFGLTEQHRAWINATNLSVRISRLAPVLVERDPEQPPVPEVVRGGRRDAFGNPSVTGLLKVHEGRAYYFAVNALDAEVSAKLPLKAGEKVTVLFEDRSLAAGAVEDVFKPLDVHIYSWKTN